MKNKKLNKNWNAEPNAPKLDVSQTVDGVKLTFLLDPAPFEHIEANDSGTIEFSGVYAYRRVEINKEEYLAGEFNFKNSKLPWGEFYELSQSNWAKDLPIDMLILNDSISKKKIRHFVFFLKDEIFECLCLDYMFSFINTISEYLDKTYPKGYFNHYLAMFTSVFNTPSIDNFKVYADLYIQMESIEEFINLKAEIKSIQKNNDLNHFVKIANYFEIENFGNKQLLDMIKVIEKHKVA